MGKILCTFIFISFLYLWLGAQITYVHSILRLNEIYPAPQNGESEWIELYNDEDDYLDLLNYTLFDLANNNIYVGITTIAPFGFTIATSSSILNNTGDTIFLKRNNNVVEIATYSGSFNSSETFTRCPDGSGDWQTLNSVTKNLSNTEACLTWVLSQTEPTVTPTIIPPTPTPLISPISPTAPITPTPKTPTPTPTPISYDNVLISEIMVRPHTQDNEWVELYNNNEFTVDLNNWYLDDAKNAGSSPKLFSLTMPPKEYGIIDLSFSMFDNAGDSVRLLDFNQTLKDSFTYSTSEKGKSWGRKNNEEYAYCIQEASKSQNNNNCLIVLLNGTNESEMETSPSPTPIPSQFKKLTIPKLNTSPLKSSPRKRSIYESTKKPFNQTLVKEYSSINPFPNVLGASDDKLKRKTIKSLSFSSLLFSLLTILSLSLRITKQLTPPEK